MYQPYLRGKQFELIGIKELTPDILSLNKLKVSLIIEPVKDSSTLKNTLITLVEYDINFTIIVNPQVGSFTDTDSIFNTIKSSVGQSKNFQVGIIFHNRIKHQKEIEVLKNNISFVPALSIIHNAPFDNISEIIERYKEHFIIKYNVINLTATSIRYHRNFDLNTRIELDDYFNAKTKNADYLQVVESNFSEEHLFYKEDGFIGFSDYLSIGEEYTETGFLPYAVAIHLSYNEKQTNKIKVKHFVSDSNDDTSDIAGKFKEALTKLINWCDRTGYDSIAIPRFREFYNNGHFPGLGTLKKLSLMNHIDLVLKLI